MLIGACDCTSCNAYYEKFGKKAAPEKEESAQHIHQQLQADICPACKGSGVDPVQDVALTKVCRVCGGTGKRSAV